MFWLMSFSVVPDAAAQAPAPGDESRPDAAAKTPAEVGAPRVVEDAESTPTKDLREKVDAELAGKPIGRISFTCDLEICDNPANTAEFVDISGLYVGQAFALPFLDVAETRLAKTGFFDKLSVTKELVGGSVFIEIKARGATLIRNVEFSGAETPPFESELRKLLIYRQGQAYRADRQKALTQIESLRTLYEKEGYFGTRIKLNVKRVEGATHLVDLYLEIARGSARRVCDVGVRGAKAMTYAEARELLLSDGSFFSRRLQLVNSTFTTRGFKEGQLSLVDAYRRRGFFQARIVDKGAQFDKHSSCVTLLVDIVEGPRWQLDFVGNKRFTAADLTENLPFYESGYVDAEEIRRAERAIEKLYETRGHPFATVTGTETKRDDLDRTLEFVIVEGPQLEIRDLKFYGNLQISTEELKAVMSTRVFALFDVGGYLQTDELLGDFGRIESLYRERGYHRAQIPKFEIAVEGNALKVRVWIEEGAPTLITRVDVDGNRKTTDGELLSQLQAVAGQPFVPVFLKSDQTRMVQRYSRLGYPLAQVKSQCFLASGEEVVCEAPRMPRACVARLDEELEGRCKWSDDKKTKYTCARVAKSPECVYGGGVTTSEMRVRHAIVEGPRVYVGARLLKGNFETRSSVINREIELERGDLLDTQRLIQGQGNLRQLNVFDSVSVETIGLDERAQQADTARAALLINVEEASTSYVDFKAGLELREPFVDTRQLLLTSEVQYTNRNLFGLAQGIQPRVIGAFDTLQLAETTGVSTADPLAATSINTLDYVFGGEILYSHPRFLKEQLNIDKLYFSVGPFYLLDLLGVINSQVLREEWGLRSEFRKDLSELMNRLFFKLGLEFKQIATFGADGQIVDGQRIFSPRRTVAKVEPVFTLDRRDSPLNPKSGYLLRLEPSFVSGDALGSGGGFVVDAFFRLQFGASHFVPLWRGELVFGQGIRAGQAIPLAKRTVLIPLEDRFFLGGIRSVRGFEDDTLGPVSSSQAPTGGEFFLNYNAELRYPLIRKFSVYGATFFDAGLLSDCFPENSTERNCYEDAFGSGVFSEVRTSAGLGFRALILDQIPIVLDYGVVLNRRPGERFGQVHLNVGYTFD